MSDVSQDDQPYKIVEEATVESPAEQEKTEAVAELSVSSSNKGELRMDVKVHSPFKVYYQGPAFSISAENTTGPFDILPTHHNFITLLSPCELVVRTVDKGEQKIQISGGIMHVKADKVIVFLDV